MTGYTVHTGSNEKFSSGWDQIFGKPGTKKNAASSPKATVRGKKKAKKKK